MKTIKDLKQMISEPASKEWFKKHGGAKSVVAKKMSNYDKEMKKFYSPEYTLDKRSQAQFERREREKGSNLIVMKKMGRKEAFQKQQEDTEKKRWGKTSGVKY